MKHEPFVILSAEKSDLTPEANLARTTALYRQLEARDLAFKPVKGMYKGQRENPFVVLAIDGTNEFDQVLSLAKRYGQESILYSDADRFTTLHFLSSDPG